MKNYTQEFYEWNETTEEKHTIIKLGPKDAAVVFNENEFSVFFPNQEDDEDAYQSTTNALRCALFLRMDSLLKIVDERIDSLVEIEE